MPSTITHTFIGLGVLKKLNSKPQQIIIKRLDNYKIYCQSMDILYFYHILLLKENNIQEFGHRFHKENIYNSFKIIIDDVKKTKDFELFTFLSGLIVHYQADSIIHPFINYLSYSQKERKIKDKHLEIETYIDNYYIKNNLDTNYKQYNFNNFISQHTEEKMVKEEINKIFKQLYNYDNMGTKYYKSLNNMIFVNKHIRYDKYGLKRKIYQLIDINPFPIRRVKYLSYHFNLNDDNYYLNLNHQKWFNYADKSITSSKSFLDLYDEVVIKASNIINQLYLYSFENKEIDLKKLIGNNSYSNGLEIAQTNKESRI